MRSRTLLLMLLPMLVSCDAWKLERTGRSKCEEGTALVRRAAAGAQQRPLSDADRRELSADLRIGLGLLREGMASFAKANEKTGKTYDVQTYMEAMKVARMKLAELAN